ncbi:TetR/AcrR family transcriptional regulator [Octadecabacter ascidiaceicola]|uniref:HTH-type transcriptional repressor AcnR n=1 Tax=Octadecabacter ascidiaceicola TaxID=1655543 RepID=A0A238JL39_9RHOB|nr:TetR/AcrR family transcriptional regulator [Octadecabacter ascidiaceicola]SMX30924.1 HTH-type transcriptional repressor AcnR [Octadecabacter ascidiaceicola]
MKTGHNTKNLIRDAARSLFAEHGYNGVSMREIAQGVGKQPGGIYNHFPNKQAILVDLMQENLSRAHDAVIAPINNDLAPSARLEQFVRSHVLHNIANPDDIFIAYMELRSLEPDGATQILKERNDYEAALRAILRDGQTAGDFKISDPAIHARSILSMLGGVTVWFRQSGPQTPTDVVECYVQAALQSVGATYSAPPER